MGAEIKVWDYRSSWRRAGARFILRGKGKYVEGNDETLYVTRWYLVDIATGLESVEELGDDYGSTPSTSLLDLVAELNISYEGSLDYRPVAEILAVEEVEWQEPTGTVW